MSPSEPEREPDRDQARDEDAAWRAIVDNFGDRAVLDDAPPERPAPAADEVDAVPGSPRGLIEPAELHDEPTEHFVPPPPPPIGRTTPARTLAWVGLFGVPAIVLVLMVAGVTLATWLGLVLMGWFVGGFVFLVASMKPDDRDGYDDGAVL